MRNMLKDKIQGIEPQKKQKKPMTNAFWSFEAVASGTSHSQAIAENIRWDCRIGLKLRCLLLVQGS
jgi:hypothetical protein